jgi:hypothetical protein
VALYGGCVVLLAIWLSCIPRARYPGISSFGMGDIPEYYVLARNVYSGRGFVVDYFIGDFWTGPKLGIEDVVGSTPTAARRPLAPYVAASLFCLTGLNHYVIHIAASMLGSVVPLGFYGVMARRLAKRGPVSAAKELFCQFGALALCLLPTHFLLFGLGTVSLFELLPWLVLFLLAELREWASWVCAGVMAASAGLVTASRPEGVVLVAALFVVYIAPAALRALVRRRFAGELTAAGLVLGGVALMNVPLLFIRYAPGAGVYYHTLRYDVSRDALVPMYLKWPDLNHAIVHANFSAAPTMSWVINRGAAGEILRHPGALCRWWGVQLGRKTVSFLRFYGSRRDDSTRGA